MITMNKEEDFNYESQFTGRTIRCPTAVINGSLYGVVSEGLANPEIDHVIGMVNGIEGFLADHTIDMAPLKENDELERIRTTPFISWFLPL